MFFVFKQLENKPNLEREKNVPDRQWSTFSIHMHDVFPSFQLSFSIALSFLTELNENRSYLIK